jgi:hypothetical protein
VDLREKTLEKITYRKNEELCNIFNKFNKYYYCDQIKDYMMGGICSTRGCCHIAAALVEKIQEQRPTRGWEDNIKIHLNN